MGLGRFISHTLTPWQTEGERNWREENKTRSLTADIAAQDPTQSRGAIGGKYYNFAGDFIGRDPNYSDPSGAPGSGSDDLLASLQAELAALNNSQPYVPKLPTFDIMGNYTKAKKAAEQNINPLYEKKLTDFLSNQNRLKTQKNQSVDLERENVAAQLQEILGANAVDRTRVDEDTDLALDLIDQNEGYFQDDEGEANELERTALIEDVASAGLTTSGLGRKRVADQQRRRNIASERQLTAFNQDRDARELYRSRTFEDLTTSDTLAQGQSTRQNKAIDLDLESYMDDLAFEEQGFRLGNEIDRFQSVLQDTETRRRTGVEEFVAELIGGGRRAEDIQLARSIYL